MYMLALWMRAAIARLWAVNPHMHTLKLHSAGTITADVDWLVPTWRCCHTFPAG
jgi:hypothetical protein